MNYDPDRLLDIKEAATLLQVKPGTLYAWVERGKIPHRKVGSLVRFLRADLMNWTTEGVHKEQRKARRTRLSMVK